MPPNTASNAAATELLASSYPGTNEGVRDALANLKAKLARRGASEEEAFSAELVVAEALNNVVEHAFADMSEAEFVFTVGQSPNGIHIEITDRGRAMPDGQLPIGNAPMPCTEPASLPEGGFGWFLIREIARDLLYVRTGDQNRLTFRIAICKAELA